MLSQWKYLPSGLASAWALGILLTPSLGRAATAIEQRLAANPQGSVEIINVAGSIEIQGWDRSEVEVSGTAGKDVERVDLSGDGGRITVRVVQRSQHSFGAAEETRLLIHVPANSAISASLVSAELTIAGVKGEAQLQTISGDMSGEVGGDVRANAISGNIHLTANSAKNIEIKSISGDIGLTGGDAATEVTTVSGDAKMSLGAPSRLRFKTVSGSFSAAFIVSNDAQIDAESVSGNIKLDFPTAPAADFDIQTLSGEITNCFGPKAIEPRHGPGSRLTFKTGDTHARIQITTKSGDVRLCAKT
jgi:DUF4097 and DUF4098 domain-containing protein YvlB